MDGHKWDLFCLVLRFAGWIILCFLTAGVGILQLIPYMTVSIAHFYRDIFEESEVREGPEQSTGKAVDRSDLADGIIERVMALDKSIKDRDRVRREVESVVDALADVVDVPKEEIERIAAEVLAEESRRK